MNNIKNVLLIIISLVGLLGFAYLMFIFQGLIVGTTTNVALDQNNGLIDNTSVTYTHLQTMESNYINAADNLESKIKLALSIFAIVILLVLFGVKAYGAYKDRGGF